MTKALLLTLLLATASYAEWITPKGKAYHPRRTCIALRTTVAPQQVTKAEAERRGLHVCGICSRAKK